MALDPADLLVPLAELEKLERAQLEILAIALYRERFGFGALAWAGQNAAVRESMRAEAHLIMQGLEPPTWRKI